MPRNLPGALAGVVTVLPKQRVFASQTRYRPSPPRGGGVGGGGGALVM